MFFCQVIHTTLSVVSGTLSIPQRLPAGRQAKRHKKTPAYAGVKKNLKNYLEIFINQFRQFFLLHSPAQSINHVTALKNHKRRDAHNAILAGSFRIFINI